MRLHARAEARYADADAERDVKGELQRAGFGPKLIDAQLANLRKAVERLEWKASASTWSTYSERGHYTDADLEAKEAFVAAATAALDGADGPRPRAPTTDASRGWRSTPGRRSPSRSTATTSWSTTSTGSCGARARRGSCRSSWTSPTRRPGLGWRGRERPSFVDRVRPDLVLCLAVIHHLALSGTVPFPEIVAFLHDFAAPLVVEMPHRDDPMAARLLARKRAGVFDHYDRPQWEAALRERFEVDEQVTLPSGTRTLYRCRPR